MGPDHDFLPFIVDASVTLVKRVLHGKRVWEAHREHYYQRVVLSGWSHRRTVLAEYGVMILCGGLAVSYHHSTDNVRVIILGVWAGMFVLLAMLVHMLEGKMATSCPVPDSQVAGSKKKYRLCRSRTPPE